MNREKFIEAIENLGYKVEISWNGLNDRLYAPNGNPTAWRVCHDCIEPSFIPSDKLWGDSFNGVCKLYYDEMNVTDNYVSVGAGKSGALFFNHDKSK